MRERLGDRSVDDVLDDGRGRPAPRAGNSIGRQLATVRASAPGRAVTVLYHQCPDPTGPQSLEGGPEPCHCSRAFGCTLAEISDELSLALHLGGADNLVRGACTLRPFGGHREPELPPDQRQCLFRQVALEAGHRILRACLLYTSPSPRDRTRSR